MDRNKLKQEIAGRIRNIKEAFDVEPEKNLGSITINHLMNYDKRQLFHLATIILKNSPQTL